MLTDYRGGLYIYCLREHAHARERDSKRVRNESAYARVWEKEKERVTYLCECKHDIYDSLRIYLYLYIVVNRILVRIHTFTCAFLFVYRCGPITYMKIYMYTEKREQERGRRKEREIHRYIQVHIHIFAHTCVFVYRCQSIVCIYVHAYLLVERERERARSFFISSQKCVHIYNCIEYRDVNYICTYKHVCISNLLTDYIYTYTYTYIQIIHTYAYIYIYIYIHIHIFTYTYIFGFVYRCQQSTYVNLYDTHIHVYICICM